jgi:putative ABC transport system substrate-binding protein
VKSFLIFLLLSIAIQAHAQGRVPRIGILVLDLGRAQSQAIKGLSAELKGLGYTERKNIYLETRNAKGDRGTLQTAAKELAAKKVDLIFTTGTRASTAAAEATREIPLVFVNPGDPVAAGLVKTAAGNITGVAAYAADTTDQRLALLKEIAPRLTKIHVFFDANSSTAQDRIATTESSTKKIGLQLIAHGVKSADELKTTVSNLSSDAGAAIFHVTDDLVESEADFIFTTARQKKLPTMFNEEVWAIAGATAAYGPSYLDMGRAAARIIDQILKGKAPAAIPIQRSSKFDLTINYRAANAIGLQLSNSLLKKADKVIR